MLTSGTKLGPYTILAPLGAGGMGEVYRAQDERLGREVALKVLPPQFADDADRLARFQREAKAVAALAHPNILVVYDFGTDQGQTYAITELLEGESLRQRLSQSALPWRKAVELAVAMADGLAAAHAKGIVHRDLKPDNIFLTGDDRIKILDFGLAKLLTDGPTAEPVQTQEYSPALTRTGTVLGTAPYMSPEQLRGQPVDAHSDIFSLGCTLYEMIAGKRPFTGKTEADVTAAILHNDPPELIDLDMRIPVELERLIRRCLEKNPESRFQSARDLAFALKGIASGSTEVQVTPPANRRFYVGLALAGAAVAALILGVVLWPRPQSVNPIDAGKGLAKSTIAVAVLPFKNLSKDEKAEYLCNGLPGGIIKSLSEIGDLKVRSFNSVALFVGKSASIEELGRSLKVQAVLMGEVSRHQDSFTIDVELVNVADDSVLLRGAYDSKTLDIQAAQLEIVQKMCAKLNVTITAEEEIRLGKRFTNNKDAYNLCLLGRLHLFKETDEGAKKAEEYFRQAIAKDSTCALAHAGLADTYLFAEERLMSPQEALSKARDAATTALRLDEGLAEAHIVLGNILFWYDWKWAAAEKEIKRALEIRPNLLQAQDTYFFWLVRQRRFSEAEKFINKAVEDDPVTPWINIDVAFLHYYKREFDQAIQQCRKVMEVDPNYVTAHRVMGWAYLEKKDYAQALVASLKACELDDSIYNKAWLGLTYGLQGDTAQARKILDEMKDMLAKGRYVAPNLIAVLHLGLGEKTQACEWFEKAYEQRNSVMILLDFNPIYASLLSEPRFVELVKKMQLP